jgi:peptide-methionine (S)-S-oxide reductase
MLSRILTASFVLALALALGVSCPALADDQAGADQAQPRENTKADTDQAQPKENANTGTEKADAARGKTEKATFGGGCFWCFEAIFERIKGVKTVVSGYAGGNIPRPSYELVSTGLTGHAEVVQIEYDPDVVTFEKLLEVFWASHDPTTLNRQGPDFGTQYRSIILYHTEAQKLAAQKSYKELTSAGVFGDPIVTQLEPYRAFYPADRHHQDYYRKNRNAMYCQMHIVPKLKKLHLIK